MPPTPSCPGLSRASTFFLRRPETWMAGTSPAMTQHLLSHLRKSLRPGSNYQRC
ncbi:hypothetical protein CDS [Bradyrhizobium sp.]|nr:hypothetical protein CDS [Bradyrhizobium sp.]